MAVEYIAFYVPYLLHLLWKLASQASGAVHIEGKSSMQSVFIKSLLTGVYPILGFAPC
jgi:hypothetical protein